MHTPSVIEGRPAGNAGVPARDCVAGTAGRAQVDPHGIAGLHVCATYESAMDAQDVHDVTGILGQDLLGHSQPEDYRIDGDTSLPVTEKTKKLSKSRDSDSEK